MKNFFSNIYFSIKQKKGFFIVLISLTILAIILAVVSGLKFTDGILVIDLSNIAYIQFLKEDINFISLFFRLVFALLIFLIVIVMCNAKLFLVPLAILFYLYLIYSQVVVLVSIILIYGFFNSIILILLLLIFVLFNCVIFLLIFVESNSHCNSTNYFKESFSSNFLSYLILLLVTTFTFCLVLNILKSFVILLIY